MEKIEHRSFILNLFNVKTLEKESVFAFQYLRKKCTFCRNKFLGSAEIKIFC